MCNNFEVQVAVEFPSKKKVSDKFVHSLTTWKASSLPFGSYRTSLRQDQCPHVEHRRELRGAGAIDWRRKPRAAKRPGARTWSSAPDEVFLRNGTRLERG